MACRKSRSYWQIVVMRLCRNEGSVLPSGVDGSSACRKPPITMSVIEEGRGGGWSLGVPGGGVKEKACVRNGAPGAVEPSGPSRKSLTSFWALLTSFWTPCTALLMGSLPPPPPLEELS